MSGRRSGPRARAPIPRANGLTLVAGLVFTTVALAALGSLVWGLWWHVVQVAAPITLVVFGVIGIIWSQQRSPRRRHPGHHPGRPPGGRQG